MISPTYAFSPRDLLSSSASPQSNPLWIGGPQLPSHGEPHQHSPQFSKILLHPCPPSFLFRITHSFLAIASPIRKWRVSNYFFGMELELSLPRHSREQMSKEKIKGDTVMSQEELLLRHSRIGRKVLPQYVQSTTGEFGVDLHTHWFCRELLIFPCPP
jgi:hypothetical protein